MSLKDIKRLTTMKQNAFCQRFFVNSFLRSPNDIHWPIYASILRLLYRWIAITSTLHDLKTNLTPTTPRGMSSLTSIHRGSYIITSLLSLLHAMVGSTPCNIFSTCPKLACIAFRYTCATWMRRAMIRVGDWALVCNLKLIVIPYHLLPCRSFSHVRTYTIYNNFFFTWALSAPRERPWLMYRVRR